MSAADQEQDFQEIESLIDELAALAKSSVDAREFHRELVERSVQGLAANGGAFWLLDGDGFTAAYQADLPSGLEEHAGHRRLLSELQQAATGRIVGPRSGYSSDSDDEAIGDPTEIADADSNGGLILNPTDSLIIGCSVRHEDQPLGILEVFQRAGGSPAAHAGYLRFVETMAEIASEFYSQRSLRRVEDRAERWQTYEDFTSSLHGSLDGNRVSYAIASDGRRMIDCDRLSVARVHGRRAQILAVSGVDSVNRRSNVIRSAERLAVVVSATGEPIWLQGGAENLPPKLQDAVDDYLAESAPRVLGVVPVFSRSSVVAQNDATGQAAAHPSNERPIGTLIVECYDAIRDVELLENRTAVVARHAGLALQNVDEYESLPLLGVLRAMRTARRAVFGERISRTVLVLLFLIAAICALVFVPADFEVAGRGELQPELRRDIFAAIDGVVDEPPKSHGKNFAKGDRLLKLRNVDLEFEYARVAGEILSKQEARNSLLGKRLSLDMSAADAIETRNELTAQEQELNAQLKSLEELKSILDKQRALLEIKSPIAGQVLTWDVEDLLLDRPVKRGQLMMKVADLKGAWVLEIHVPDRDIGHVFDAHAESDEPLRVDFVLATNPNITYEGRIQDIAMTTTVGSDGEATVLVTVELDEDEVEELRPGASVIPRIDCGRRSIGYVWFHGVFDWVKTRVLF